MVSFASKDEADRFAEAARRRIPGGVTLATAIDAYVADLKRRGMKETTVRTTGAHARVWLDRCPTRLPEMTLEGLQSAYQKRCAEGVAIATHHEEIATLRRVLSFAVAQGWVKQNVATGIKLEGRPNRGKVTLRIGEAQRFVETATRMATSGDERGLAALVTFWTAFRNSEVLGLMVRDVDFTADGQCWIWLDKGKTKNAKRHVQVPGEVAALLRPHVACRAPTERVFIGRGASGRRNEWWLRNAVGAVCEAAGVVRVLPHGLRGSFATIAEEGGAVGDAVRRMLGQSSHRVTERHYLAAGTMERAQAARVLKLVSGTANDSMPVPSSETVAEQAG